MTIIGSFHWRCTLVSFDLNLICVIVSMYIWLMLFRWVCFVVCYLLLCFAHGCHWLIVVTVIIQRIFISQTTIISLLDTYGRVEKQEYLIKYIDGTPHWCRYWGNTSSIQRNLQAEDDRRGNYVIQRIQYVLIWGQRVKLDTYLNAKQLSLPIINVETLHTNLTGSKLLDPRDFSEITTNYIQEGNSFVPAAIPTVSSDVSWFHYIDISYCTLVQY